jgi:Clostridium P-47 protein
MADKKQIKNLPLGDWDVAYAVRLSAINAAIVAWKSSPTHMQFCRADRLPKNPQPDSDCYQYNVDCTFGDWELSSGTGGLLYITLPIQTLTLEKIDLCPEPNKPRVTKFVPLTATLLCQLKWRPSATDPQVEELVVAVPPVETPVTKRTTKTQPAGSEEPSTTPAPSFILTKLEATTPNPDPDYSGPDTNPTIMTVLKGLLEDMLRAQIGQFDHVFAKIDYTRQVQKEGKLGWLVPTSHAYSIQTTKPDKRDATQVAESTLVILCMTESRPSPDDVNVSAHLIPDGANSAYCFSDTLIIPHLIQPGLRHLFANDTPADAFDLSDDRLELSNCKEISFKDQQIEQRAYFGMLGHVSVTPKVGKLGLKIKISGGRLLYNVEASYLHEADGVIVRQNTQVHYNMDIRSTLALEPDPHNPNRRIFSVRVEPDTSVTNFAVPIVEPESWGRFLGEQGLNFLVQGAIMVASMGAAHFAQKGLVKLTSKTSTKAAATLAELKTGVVEVETVSNTSRIMQSAEVKAVSAETSMVIGNDVALVAQTEVAAVEGKLANWIGGQWGGMVLFMFFQTWLGFEEQAISFVANRNFKDSGNIPSFDHIVEQGIEGIEWPHAEKAGFIITSGELAKGCFNIGVNLVAKA